LCVSFLLLCYVHLFFVALRFELVVSDLLGRCSAIRVMPLALFALVIFHVRFHLSWPQTSILPTESCMPMTTDVNHQSWFTNWDGFSLTFFWADLEHRSFWSAEITDLSHYTLPSYFFKAILHADIQKDSDEGFLVILAGVGLITNPQFTIYN
jgi:hypothetical protein